MTRGSIHLKPLKIRFNTSKANISFSNKMWLGRLCMSFPNLRKLQVCDQYLEIQRPTRRPYKIVRKSELKRIRRAKLAIKKIVARFNPTVNTCITNIIIHYLWSTFIWSYLVGRESQRTTQLCWYLGNPSNSSEQQQSLWF